MRELLKQDRAFSPETIRDWVRKYNPEIWLDDNTAYSWVGESRIRERVLEDYPYTIALRSYFWFWQNYNLGSAAGRSAFADDLAGASSFVKHLDLGSFSED